MENYEFDLAEVNLSICGIAVAGGGASSGFVSVSMPKRFEHKDGVHGDAVSYKTGNTTATFTLQLLEADPAVEDLLALANDDMDSATGAGVGPFLLENMGTGREIRGNARLDGYPSEVAYTADAPELSFEGRIFGCRMTTRSRAAI